MLTYLITLDNDLVELQYNCSVNENKNDKEGCHDIPGKKSIILNKLPKGFMDEDWVYFDDKGNMCLVDDRPLEPIYEEYDHLRTKCFMSSNPEDLAKYNIAKLKYDEYMQNPVLLDVEETKKYIEEREASD